MKTRQEHERAAGILPGMSKAERELIWAAYNARRRQRPQGVREVGSAVRDEMNAIQAAMNRYSRGAAK